MFWVVGGLIALLARNCGEGGSNHEGDEAIVLFAWISLAMGVQSSTSTCLNLFALMTCWPCANSCMRRASCIPSLYRFTRSMARQYWRRLQANASNFSSNSNSQRLTLRDVDRLTRFYYRPRNATLTLGLESTSALRMQNNCGSIDAQAESRLETECSICCDAFEYNQELLLTPCKHSFHRACIAQWLMESSSSWCD